MEFAEKHLKERGWRRGKGLGRHENGIVEAIKVKMKCDKAGVGHQAGEQFTFHWWDHVFNQAAANISVETKEDGVEVKKLAEGGDVSITNKKPRKARLCKELLYGRFIKADTLTPGNEAMLVKSEGTSDSDSDEDDRLDLSSTRRLTDEELVRACEGRTGHKGARHGVTMSAKLVRLAEQERQFLAGCSQRQREEVPPSGEGMGGSTVKRKKRKRRERELEHRLAAVGTGGGQSDGGAPPEGAPGGTAEPSGPTGAEGESGHARRRRKKKKRRRGEGQQSPLG